MGQLKKLYVCLSTAILHLLFGIVFRWLGLIMILTPNLSMLFVCLTGAATATSKKFKKGVLIDLAYNALGNLES